MLGAVSTDAPAPDDRSTCTPCRGTGSLISGKGGEPHPVTCPWCGGDGKFHRGRDSQTGKTADVGASD
jgi:DnaJ-class molecular chaperone